MHLLGLTFAPRLKNVAKRQLYAFQTRRAYQQQGYKLLPHGGIKTECIEGQWDEILRFIATIKLKESTASQLFKRLNAYSRQHPLYHALKEFGKLPKSDFLLRSMDTLELRQAIEKQRNKGENANKFARAVSFGNNQEFPLQRHLQNTLFYNEGLRVRKVPLPFVACARKAAILRGKIWSAYASDVVGFLYGNTAKVTLCL